jgi:hypothetical protein
MKIVEIPAEVREAFAPFREVMTRPQFRHFLHLVLGLILPFSKNKTVQAIAESYAEGTDRSCLSRFLERAPWSVEKALNWALLTLYRRLPRPKGGLIFLILDDSENEKTGKKIEGAGWFYDSLGKKLLLFGHNFVLALAQVGGVSFPVGIRLYLKKEFCREQGLRFKTKNELAAELIDGFRPPVAGAVIVLFDGWYLNETVVPAVQARGWKWVSRAKSNRRMLIEGKSWLLEDYTATLGKRELRETGFVPRSHEFPIIGCLRQGRLKKLGEVVLVFGCNEKGDWQMFASNRFGWSLEAILEAYDRRWEIECCFRESKQHLGLGESQARLLRCVVIHLHSVMIAWILLATLKLNYGLENLTLGELCRWVQEKVERCQIRFIQRHARNRKQREEAEALLLAA